MTTIKATNRLGSSIDVVTDGTNQTVDGSASLSVDPTTYLNLNGIKYERIVGEFIPDGAYTIKKGEEADRIVFNSDLGETVVAFQKV